MDDETHVEGEIGVTVERGIKKCSECGDPAHAACHLTIGHIEECGKKQNSGSLAKPAHREQGRGPGIHSEAEKREHVRGDTGGGKTADDVAQQPSAALTDPVGYRLASLV